MNQNLRFRRLILLKNNKKVIRKNEPFLTKVNGLPPNQNESKKCIMNLAKHARSRTSFDKNCLSNTGKCFILIEYN